MRRLLVTAASSIAALPAGTPSLRLLADQARLGDYATVGRNQIAIVDAESFWVDGYFEETKLHAIDEGDPARIKLMGHHDIVRGHVGSIARGIDVANAQPNGQGIASVNPIFTWVRLAQRIPVRIEIDAVPDGVHLSAGMTATVQIDPRPQRSTNVTVAGLPRRVAASRTALPPCRHTGSMRRQRTSHYGTHLRTHRAMLPAHQLLRLRVMSNWRTVK